MAQSPDSIYGRKPWNPPVQPDQVYPRWQYLGPFASNEERLVSQALAVATIPGVELASMVRPPLPQVELFREKFGYATTELGIDDIIGLGRTYDEPRISWYSGGPAGYSGTSRNSLAGN